MRKFTCPVNQFKRNKLVLSYAKSDDLPLSYDQQIGYLVLSVLWIRSIFLSGSESTDPVLKIRIRIRILLRYLFDVYQEKLWHFLTKSKHLMTLKIRVSNATGFLVGANLRLFRFFRFTSFAPKFAQ